MAAKKTTKSVKSPKKAAKKVTKKTAKKTARQCGACKTATNPPHNSRTCTNSATTI